MRKLDLAVKAADVLCEESGSSPSPRRPSVRVLRAWMAEQILNQVEGGADPVRWNDWVAGQA